MSDTPAHSIEISVAKPFDRPMLKAWYETVHSHAPNGVIATHQVADDTGERRNVCVVSRQTGGKHSYMVPLTRDLTEGEVEAVARAFADDHAELDFDISTQQSKLQPRDRQTISLDDAAHVALCTELAKRRHAHWLAERLAAGWRYGTAFSQKAKTSPLLRPWDDLPDRYKQPDYDAPKTLIDALDQQGYSVVSKDELARLQAKSRGKGKA